MQFERQPSGAFGNVRRHRSREPTAYTDRHAQASDSIRRHQQPNRCGDRPCERDRWTVSGTCMNSVAWQPKRRKLKPHRFKVGEHGPIRAIQHGSKTKFARIELRTGAQANRATRLIAEENERRSDNKPRHYPKRPFMKPALEANRSRLPTFWANSVK